MFFRGAFLRWLLAFAFVFAVPAIAAAATITPPSYPPTQDGATSASLTMTLSVAPTTGVTVTPSGTGLTFNPAAITFRYNVSVLFGDSGRECRAGAYRRYLRRIRRGRSQLCHPHGKHIHRFGYLYSAGVSNVGARSNLSIPDDDHVGSAANASYDNALGGGTDV